MTENAHHKPWRRFLLKAALLLPIPLGVMAVNVVVDPAGVFHPAEERQIVAWMLEGRNVANVHDHNDRLTLACYAEGLETSRDVLVFGSSRAMLIDTTFFPGQSLFNASVSAAALQDLLANYQLFYEKGLTPKTVVIGAEAYMLNEHHTNQLYLPRPYVRALDRLGIDRAPRPEWSTYVFGRRLPQLVSPSYFQAATSNIPQLLREGRSQAYPTTAFRAVDKMVRADGSLSYGRNRLRRSDAVVEHKARRFILDNATQLLLFRALAPERKHIFEVFVDNLLDEGVEVILLLPPYHPITYAMMLEDPRAAMILEGERYYRACAAERGLAVYGSYDPAATQCTADDFFDAVHCSREAMQRIFALGRAAAAGPAP